MHNCSLPLDESLGYLACRLHRLLSCNLARRFAEAGLEITVEQWRLLMQLWLRDGLTQNELTERLTQDKTGVSRLLKQLEERGMVRRVAVPHDRRSRSVLLADPGRSAVEQGLSLAKEVVTRAQAVVEPEQLAICKDVLHRIVAGLTPEEGCSCNVIPK